MSTRNPSPPPAALTLERHEREAIRAEIDLDASAFGDVAIAVQTGDRAAAIWLQQLLAQHIAVMDAIGWTEQPDAPDAQPVADVDVLSRYAGERIPGLVEMLDEDPAEYAIAPPAHELDQNRARAATVLDVLQRAQEAMR